MKKIFLLLLIVPALMFVLWLIPVEEKKEVVLQNRIEHVDRLIRSPRDWRKWYAPIRDACEKDEQSCSILGNDSSRGFRLHIPDRQIKVQLQQGLQYSIEIASAGNTAFVMAMSPGASMNETRLLYAYSNRLLWKALPFLSKPHDANLLMQDLKTFVESPLSFYGYNIQTEPPQGVGLLTRQSIVAKSDLFAHVKRALQQLKDYAAFNNVKESLHSNVSFIPARGDSVEIIAGIAVNRQVVGNDSIRYMKVPAGQQLLVADFNGVYAEKKLLYSAMSRYMTDHNITGRAGFYERFAAGTFPDSDSAVVKMQLCFPF